MRQPNMQALSFFGTGAYGFCGFRRTGRLAGRGSRSRTNRKQRRGHFFSLSQLDLVLERVVEDFAEKVGVPNDIFSPIVEKTRSFYPSGDAENPGVEFSGVQVRDFVDLVAKGCGDVWSEWRAASLSCSAGDRSIDEQ